MATRFASLPWLLLVAGCAQPPPPAVQAEPPSHAEPAEVAPATAALLDPLPSWHNRAAKGAIHEFVKRVTQAGSPDFVPPSERIATFDNDGTLWSEQPLYIQLAFAFDRIRELAPQHPDWKTKEPYKSVLAGDLKAALAGGERAMGELMVASHTGMTTDEFAPIVARWFATAKHPKTGRPYTELVYQPMLELLTYLRANGFKTFIVSGGGVDFMRAVTEKIYGIPPEQVIGTTGKLRYELRDGKAVLVREAGVDFIDDGPGKPMGIQRHIGRRPIAAFGNSDGDQQMLEWTASGTGPRFMLLVHHTDAAREVAYDRTSPIGKLDKALDEAKAKGWTVVSMKDDWETVFPPPNTEAAR